MTQQFNPSEYHETALAGVTPAFAFPGDLQSWAQATVVGGRLFTGSWGGKVYALNAATGWNYEYAYWGRVDVISE